MFFRSAVDPWFYGLAFGLPVILLKILRSVVLDASSTGIIVSTVGLAIASLAPLWLLISTHYQVDSTFLQIQAGPFYWRVPLEQIRAITASRALVSSPALSVNRLKIDYGQKRSILVSPKNKVAFIEALGHQPADVLKPSPYLGL
jgi:hypothetical protein